MKLKTLVVASMSLGLVVSAFAAESTTTTNVSKPKRHHRAKTVVMREYDYKAMGALPVMDACMKNGFYDVVFDGMHQNIGRAKPTVDCGKPIAFAGGINFDAQWGNRHMGYMGENVRRVSVNDAYLNVFGNVNEYTKAYASISFSDPSVQVDPNKTALVPALPKLGKYSNVYNTSNTTINSFNLEQAYITIGNFDVFPMFLNLGKQYQDYGRYEIHPMTRTITQVLTETLRTSAQLGFITRMGINGSAYVYDNALRHVSGETALGNGGLDGSTTPDWGVSLGYAQPTDVLGYLGFDFGAGYLYNMTGVNDVAFAVTNFRTANGAGNTAAGFNNRVGSGALYGDLNSGPFTVSARYTVALQTYNQRDLGNKTLAVGQPLSQGARPWGADITAGYNFNGWSTWWGRNQNVYVGYQASGDSIAIYLPKSRWLAGYNVDVWKNTNVAIEGNHDLDYNQTTGGSGSSSNTLTLRVGVKFG